MAGCTGSDRDRQSTANGHQPADTVYTRQAAMGIYAYQPLRALQIIDSALIVGNISELQADQCRARIYSMSQMNEQLDSLLGGPADIRLDTALSIGKRILSHDTIRNNLTRRKDVLEILSYATRMKNDTLGWLQWSRKLLEVCRQIGTVANADAMRTETEIGAALYALGHHEQGLTKLDSVIALLSADHSPSFKFNELDALIIALKRKIVLLGTHGKYAETVPLARRIIERLDDYEAHPDAYHDGSSREPKNDRKRADYIRFYRSQAQNFITSAYTALGEHGSMFESFKQIEAGTREVTASEHIARYNALQHRMEAERQQAKARWADMRSLFIGILALLFLTLAAILIAKNRIISRKNRALAQQIAGGLKYKERYYKQIDKILNEQSGTAGLSVKDEEGTQESAPDPSQLSAMTDEQLYHYIDHIIVQEHLFTDPRFGREAVMERFHLSKERVGTVFSKGGKHAKMSTYIQQIRLEYAAQLLLGAPDKSIVQIAAESGFSSSAYFSNCFRQHFGISPSDYRREATEHEEG